jgi:Spirocyclase AveC-like
MATTEEAPLSSAVKATSATEATLSSERRMRPVLWWAAVGVFFLAVAVFSWGSWILASDFTPIEPGVTPVPAHVVWGNYIQEVAGVVALLLVMYFIVIRPWRRDGHITLDGIIVLAATVLYWCDPLPNYFGPTHAYNSALLNWGSWGPHIPGWVSANGNHMLEPILYAGTWNGIGLIGLSMLFNSVMRRSKRRWPKLGKPGLILIAVALGIFFDFVIEMAYVRLGTYVYPGVFKPLTLFYGHHYQFPLLVAIFTGGSFGLIACIRYFTNDKGQTVVEGRIDDVGVQPWQRHLLRFLAIFGVFNVLAMIPCAQYWWTSQHEAPWPKDILERSYYMNGICGAGTDVACPGGVIPVIQRGTAHLSPDNTVVVPSDKSLPQPVPFLTK